MTLELMENIMSRLPLGYAYHEVSFNGTGEIQDIVLKEANEVFFKIWGLNDKGPYAQKVSLFSDRTADGSAWLGLYEKLKQSGSEQEQIVHILEGCYRVCIHYVALGGMVTVYQDISHEMREIEELRERNRKAEKLARDAEIFFDNTQDGLFLMEFKNGEFRYIRNNTVHQKLTGITIPLLEGKTPEEVMGAEVGKRLREGYLKCVQSGDSLTYEETVEFSEDRKHWLVRMTPISEEEGKTYLLGSRIDITELKALQNERESLLNKLNAMFAEHAAVMLLIEPQSGRIMDANPSACTFYGYTRQELLRMNIQDINVLQEEEVERLRLRALEEGKRYFLFPHKLKSGEIKLVDVYSCPITIENKTELFSIIFDVSDREQFRDDLYREKELLSVTFNSIGDGVVTTDIIGKVTSLNFAAQEITGWSNEEARGKPFTEIFRLRNETTGHVVENPIQKVLETGRVIGLANHTVLINRQEIAIPIADSAAPIKDSEGKVYGVVMVFRDVSLEKEQRERILYLSYRDPLTGLYNRRFIEEEMRRIDKPEMLPLTVIMGDVNGLKVTNDVFGHASGDLLLKEVARIFQVHVRRDDVIARWGGDEFLILMPHTQSDRAQALIQSLKNEFAKSSSGSLQISVAMGFDVKLREGEKLPQVLRKAEEQMYHQKLLEGKSYRNSIINTLLATLYEKSMETEEHTLRLEKNCIAMAEVLRLAPEDKNELSLLALLHDIGKVGVRMETLQKTGPLSDEEWKELKRHPEIGYRIAQNTPELSTAAEYILSHHERWDGGGYPRGMKGAEIPLLCRILAVADAYDAMTNNRAYRKAMGREAALEELRLGAGSQFDPKIVEIFLRLSDLD